MTLRNTLTITALAGGVVLALLTPAPATAAGRTLDRAPIHEITGRGTGLAKPWAVSLDSAGRIYTANVSGDSITVHRPDADGRERPVRTIKGRRTGLNRPVGIDVDRHGFVYVSNFANSSITVYGRRADGNVRPLRTIRGRATGLSDPCGLEVDGRGRIYVASNWNDSVVVYGPRTSGNAAPIQRIAGARTGVHGPHDVTITPNGRLWVSTRRGSLVAFPTSADGNVPPAREIVGAATQIRIPDGVASDSRSRLYVNTDTGLLVFGARSNGNVRPQRSVRSGSRLVSTGGIEVGRDGRVVAPTNAGDVATFASFLRPISRPSAVRRLKVVGRPGAARWVARWREPADLGGDAVRRYRVTVYHAGRVVHRERRVYGIKTTLSRQNLRLGGRLSTGVHRVVVDAQNARGFGPARSVTFRVARR